MILTTESDKVPVEQPTVTPTNPQPIVTPLIPTEPAGNSTPAPNVAQPINNNVPLSVLRGETTPTNTPSSITPIIPATPASTITTSTTAPATPSAPETVLGDVSETTDPTPYLVVAAVIVFLLALLLVL